MKLTPTHVLAGAIAVTLFIALRRDPEPPRSEPAAEVRREQEPQHESRHEHVHPDEDMEPLPPGHPQVPGAGADVPQGGNLPPNHPSIGAGNANGGGNTNEVPTPTSVAEVELAWSAPPAWKSAPNPNSMRIATYTVPGKEGAAELSVSRAGGGTQANEDRWVGQFASAEKPKRSELTVASFHVRLVEVYGSFSAGMGTPGEAKPNWGLLGAIVETPDTAHFFKMTGPRTTVAAARADFENMIKNLKPLGK
jgi:hypothetical protein